MQMFTLPDGRLMAHEIWGDETGTPVLFCHGSGDSRLARNPREKLTEALAVRLITVDRPGIGGSSPAPGRSILDWASDVAALADFLSLDRFAIAGHAGGGAYALGVAQHLGERVKRVTLASPVGPFDAAGMPRIPFGEEIRTPSHWLQRRVERRMLELAMSNIPSYVEALARVAPSDASVLLDDPEMREMFEEEIEAAFSQGEQGLIDDVNALVDWGFAPEAVPQPVSVFYGDGDELLDPAVPAALAQRLPNCQAIVWAGAGHYAAYARWQELLRACL